MADPSKVWHEEGGEAQLSTLVRKLENRLATERFLDGACTRLYYGQGIFGGGAIRSTSEVPAQASAYLRAVDGLTNENLVKPVIDSCAAQVVRKPAIRVITSGASWKKSRSARKLSRLLTGLYSSSGLEAARPAIFRDSARCQVAASKWAIDPDTGKITCERALPHTIVYNPAQGAKPRDLFQRHGLPRRVLIKRHPEHARELQALPAYKPDVAFMADVSTTAVEDDLVEVVEGWHLAEGKDPGRYVMTAGNIVLVTKPWTLPVFPLVILVFGDSYSSLAGDPLARQILPFQLRLNRWLRQIEDNARDCAHPKVAIPFGAKVNQITNVSGEVIYFDAVGGGRVAWLPGQMLPPQFYSEKDNIKDDAYAAGGVSRTTAAGMKPAGVTSGRGIREARDEASGRLVLIAEALERWDEANAMVALAMMRAAFGTSTATDKKAGKDVKALDAEKRRILAPNTKMLEEIDWDEVGDLNEDEIEIRAYITSAIPNTPAGREETLEEWVQQDVISRKRALRWQANPDVATLEDEDSAVEDFARKLIEAALDDGREMAPEPAMGQEGLAMSLDLSRKALLDALCMPEPPPPAHLDLLRRLISATELLIKAPPAPAPPMAPGPRVPPAPPLAAPPVGSPQPPAA